VPVESTRTARPIASSGFWGRTTGAAIALLAAHKAGKLLDDLKKSKGGYAPNAAASVAGASEYAQVLDDTETNERTVQPTQRARYCYRGTIDILA
jgi:hypothetical protein